MATIRHALQRQEPIQFVQRPRASAVGFSTANHRSNKSGSALILGTLASNCRLAEFNLPKFGAAGTELNRPIMVLRTMAFPLGDRGNGRAIRAVQF